jgi:phage-related protein
MAGSSVIGALRVNLGIDSAAFSNGLKKAQSGLAKFGSLARTGLAAAAAGATAAAGAMAYAVKGAIDAADDMSKAASKIGVPIEELSRLKYAADLSGVSFEGLQTSIGRLSKVMNEAKNGSESAQQKFAQLGVSATNADGSLKSASQVLTELSDKFASMPDGAEKTALAMELMGRSGANMIPLLNGGSAALEKLMGEADQFGQVFTAEMGANAEAFNDNISRLQGAFGNLAAKVATELLPYLKQFTEWLVQNSPAIAEWSGKLAGGFQFVTNEIVRFRNEAVQFGQDVQAIVQWFADLDAKVRAFGEGMRTGLADAFNSVVAKISEIVQQVSSVADQIIQAFAALPARMLEIGGQIIDGLWQGIQAKWESVKGGLTDIANSITSSVKSTLGIHSPSRVMHGVGVNIMQGLDNGMQSVDVQGGATSVASNIESAFSGIGASLGDAISGTKEWSDVLKDVLRQVVSLSFSKMGGGSGGFGGFFSGLLGGLLGFERGGSILPGGAGGIDSQLVAFRKSPNERVDITKPGQRSGGGSLVFSPTINAPNSDAAGLARVQRQISDLYQDFGKMADGRAKTRDLRGTRG